MNTTIYYFSGTGNSLMIARSIASKLQDTEVIRINDEVKVSAIDDCTRVGLVFPVYYGGLPYIVKRFISSLTPYRNCYFFAVSNYASVPGRALPQLSAELQDVGISLSSGFHLRMPQNFTIGYNAPNESDVLALLNNALGKIPEIVDTIKSMKIRTSAFDISSYLGQSRRYLAFIDGVKKSDTKFWCEESCNECETCLRVCPVHNIVIVEGRPKWINNCEQCLACVNWCPTESIQYGQGSVGRGRYTNPQTTLDDFRM
ncbi:MAG: EFR1 family ferrodoxin [Candidatus Thorarchaeota archaeon]